MDSLFEFESKRTHKMLREQARKSILTNPYIYLLYMVGLTIMFFAILLTIENLNFSSVSEIVASIIVIAFFEIIWLIPIVIFLVAYTALLIFISYKKAQKRDLEISGGELVHYHISFYNDYFVIASETDGSTLNFKYSQIKRVTSSKNNYCIFTKGHQKHIFSKSSITNGNIEDFKAFMRTKDFKLR